MNTLLPTVSSSKTSYSRTMFVTTLFMHRRRQSTQRPCLVMRWYAPKRLDLGTMENPSTLCVKVIAMSCTHLCRGIDPRIQRRGKGSSSDILPVLEECWKGRGAVSSGLHFQLPPSLRMPKQVSCIAIHPHLRHGMLASKP